jgi:hypothetical protein
MQYYYGVKKYSGLAQMIGLTMVSVENLDDAELIFTADTGLKFVLYHEQDCCESVYIESIVGDLKDLVGFPILVAEESTSKSPLNVDSEISTTWTFYKFATIKGYVDVRWQGQSTGFYSESVDMRIE